MNGKQAKRIRKAALRLTNEPSGYMIHVDGSIRCTGYRRVCKELKKTFGLINQKGE